MLSYAALSLALAGCPGDDDAGGTGDTESGTGSGTDAATDTASTDSATTDSNSGTSAGTDSASGGTDSNTTTDATTATGTATTTDTDSGTDSDTDGSGTDGSDTDGTSGTGTGTTGGVNFPCVSNDNQEDCEADPDECTWDENSQTCSPADVADACEQFETERSCDMVALCMWDAEDEVCVPM